MRYDAALFDMDGTLVDSERMYGISLSRSLKERDYILDEEQAVQLIYGRAWCDVYKDLQEIFPDLVVGIDELDQMLLVHFHALQKESPEDFIISGSRILLKKLAQQMPVVIVSGSTRQHLAHFIALLEIADDIQFYIGSEDYAQGKPSPEPYLQAAERLGVLPERCVVFEDSHVGVLAAKAAGTHCVALQRPGCFMQDVSTADHIVEDLGQWA